MIKTTKENIGDVLVIKINEKEANLSKSELFKEYVLNELKEGSANIIISFEGVEYLDSSFLGALVGILKSILMLNGNLFLTDMHYDIINLFELTRLDKIFVLIPTVKLALEEF